MSIVEANSIYESLNYILRYLKMHYTEAIQESLDFLGVACLFSTTTEWTIVKNFLE